MILYKSIASVQSYREFLKHKMDKAKDYSSIRPRVSTVNKKYMQQKRNKSNSTAR